jgi:hypothetical protein
MNQKQRKEWEELVLDSVDAIKAAATVSLETYSLNLIVAANAHLLKLERELQNIKGHKRIARVLMPKETN